MVGFQSYNAGYDLVLQSSSENWTEVFNLFWIINGDFNALQKPIL